MPLRSNAQKDNDLQIEVEDNVITVASNMKILGIHGDSKLNLNGYIAFLCVKAGRQLNVSECMKGYLDYVSRMAIYNSFIISTSIIAILSGCSSVSHQRTNIQKRLLRFVCNDFVSNYSELLEKCVSGGEALRYMSMVVYKCVKNMTPQYLNEMFTLKKCTYYLRDSSLLDRPAARLTDCSLKYFKIYGAKMWNLLPAL